MFNIAAYAQHTIVPSVIALVAIAVYTDCRWRLIKNWLTLPAIILGLLLNSLATGWSGLLFSLMGLGAGLVLMMIPFLLGQMGGGDVKLMSALGALLGAYPILNVFLYTMIAGGLLALGFALYRRQGLSTVRRTWHLAVGMFIFRTGPVPDPNNDQPIIMPYSLAIAAGTLTYLIAGKVV